MEGGRGGLGVSHLEVGGAVTDASRPRKQPHVEDEVKSEAKPSTRARCTATPQKGVPPAPRYERVDECAKCSALIRAIEPGACACGACSGPVAVL